MENTLINGGEMWCFGVYSPDGRRFYNPFGLFALQHRGQESVGIATINEKV